MVVEVVFVTFLHCLLPFHLVPLFTSLLPLLEPLLETVLLVFYNITLMFLFLPVGPDCLIPQ